MPPSLRLAAVGILLVLGMVLVFGIATAQTPSETPPQAQQSIQNDSLHWIGQRLTADVGTDDVVYELRRGPDDRFVREVVSRNGTLSFATDQLEADEYTIEDPNNAVVRTFELARQTIEVTYDRRADEVTLSSNRATFDLAVTSEGLDAETLEEMIPDSQPEDDRVVIEDATGDMVFELDTDPMPRGTYTLDFHPTDALANATLTFTKEPRTTTTRTTRTTTTATPTTTTPTTTSPTTTTSTPSTTTSVPPTATSTTSTTSVQTSPSPTPTTSTPSTTTATTPGLGFGPSLLGLLGAMMLALRRRV